jgi:hypothetical protein
MKRASQESTIAARLSKLLHRLVFTFSFPASQLEERLEYFGLIPHCIRDEEAGFLAAVLRHSFLLNRLAA